MKQLFVSFFLISAVIVSAYAQHGTHTKAKNPTEKATFMTKKWTSELSLTSNQSALINPIFLRQYKHFVWIDSLYATNHNKKAMFHSKKAARAQTDSSMKQVLTPEQYGHYYRLKTQNRPKRRPN